MLFLLVAAQHPSRLDNLLHVHADVSNLRRCGEAMLPMFVNIEDET